MDRLLWTKISVINNFSSKTRLPGNTKKWTLVRFPRIVKCVYYVFRKNKMVSIIRFTGNVFYSLLYVNVQPRFLGLKYVYSAISVIVDSLRDNNKNRVATRSWTARVQLFHPWAEHGATCLLQPTRRGLISGIKPTFHF